MGPGAGSAFAPAPGRRSTARVTVFAVCICGALLLPACSSTPTTVDPPDTDCAIRRYFVADLCADEVELLERAGRLHPRLKFADLTAAKMQTLTDEIGAGDLATAFYYRKLIAAPRNYALFRDILRREAEIVARRGSRDFSRSGVLVAYVPGMFYNENPDTRARGAALQRISRAMGLASTLVPIDQSAPPVENGRFICSYLRYSGAAKIVLASVSKGGSDVKMALAQCGGADYFRKVRAWINIGGLLGGTALVERMESSWAERWKTKLWFFSKGLQYKGLLGIGRQADNPLVQATRIPRHVQVVNIIGLPLARYVTPAARDSYGYLIRFGPNDGLTLAADALPPGTPTFASLKNDHYFQRGMSAERVAAVLGYVIDRIEK